MNEAELPDWLKFVADVACDLAEWEIMGVLPVKPICQGCGLRPFELECYTSLTESKYAEPNDRYVKLNEGTYNPVNGHFLCDDCYIKAGMPTLPGGWKCP